MEKVSLEAVHNAFLFLLPIVGNFFMLCSAWDAVWKSPGDAGTVTFVLSSLVTVALLQWCMHRFGKIPEERRREKEMTKASVFALAMVLLVMVSCRVTVLLHSIPLAVFVWTVSASTALFGAYLLFFLEDQGGTCSHALRAVEHRSSVGHSPDLQQGILQQRTSPCAVITKGTCMARGSSDAAPAAALCNP